MDLDGPEPMYRQIAAELERRIEAGQYPANRPIPSESALRDEFGVGRNTARAAVALLADQGLIITVKGKGSYVRPPRTT